MLFLLLLFFRTYICRYVVLMMVTLIFFASLLATVPWQYSAFSAPELALDGRSPHLARSNEEEVSAAAEKSSAHSARKVGQRACQVCNPVSQLLRSQRFSACSTRFGSKNTKVPLAHLARSDSRGCTRTLSLSLSSSTPLPCSIPRPISQPVSWVVGS